MNKLRGYGNSQEWILCANLHFGSDYDRQEKNIISWHQRDISEEIAISFLEPYVCLETWRIICLETGKECEELVPFPNRNNLENIIDQLENEDPDVRSIVLSAYSRQTIHLKELFKLFEIRAGVSWSHFLNDSVLT